MGDKRDQLYSFINPREPSMDRRQYQRPVKSKKNLDAILDESTTSEAETVASSCSSDYFKTDTASVFLRMRPLCKKTKEQFDSRYIVDNNIFITQCQENESSSNSNIKQNHFTFSNIFKEDIPQAEIYNTCVASSIENEANSTVMTYGTSGSGKTFTVMGNPEQPGIVPRAIEHIFTVYKNNIFPQPMIKNVDGILSIMDDDMIAYENKIREYYKRKISAEIDLSDYDIVKENIMLDHLFAEKDINNLSVYIWISFAEIYNENIYDLLASDGIQQSKVKKLKIISNHGDSFITGLTTIHAKTSDEAYGLLQLGLKKVQYAETKVNANSSRSHCIFFIDVIKYAAPDHISILNYKFCDLAGSERLSKTGNKGSRLEEAKNINKSLLVLGRCLDTVYTNQSKKTHDVVPFRDSKLTLLIQRALSGQEQITMIVNLFPIVNFFAENLNVLSFASIAKQIIHVKQNISKKQSRSTRFSLFFARATSSPNHNSKNQNNISVEEKLLDELMSVKEELAMVKAESTRQLMFQEHTIRSTLAKQHREDYNKMANSYEERFLMKEKALNNLHNREIENLKRYYEKKLRHLRQDNDDDDEEEGDDDDDEEEEEAGRDEYAENDVFNESESKKIRLESD